MGKPVCITMNNIHLLSANALNVDKAKIVESGNGLKGLEKEGILKSTWETEKMLVTRIFSFFPQCFQSYEMKVLYF